MEEVARERRPPLLTDSVHRYGNILFALEEVIKTGLPGRPKTTLKKGVKVRSF